MRNNFTKGESYPLICVIMLVIVMLFVIIFTYASSVAKVNMMRENSKVVLDSFVTENSTEIFDSIKQGNKKTAEIDNLKYRTALIEFCTLDDNGGMLYSMDGNGQEKFHITNPVINLQSDELEITVKYAISLPIRFAGRTITSAVVPITVTSVLTEEF